MISTFETDQYDVLVRSYEPVLEMIYTAFVNPNAITNPAMQNEDTF